MRQIIPLRENVTEIFKLKNSPLSKLLFSANYCTLYVRFSWIHKHPPMIPTHFLLRSFFLFLLSLLLTHHHHIPPNRHPIDNSLFLCTMPPKHTPTLYTQQLSNLPLAEQLERFWNGQMEQVQVLCSTNRDFKNHNDLPLARIKRIMKSDEGLFRVVCCYLLLFVVVVIGTVYLTVLFHPCFSSCVDVRMIRAEAPVLFAKACELFILELTLRSSCFSEKTERRNLQKSDILAALHHTPIFDFLDAVVNAPKDPPK